MSGPAFFVGVVPPAPLAERILAWQRRLKHHITAPHVTLKAPADLTPDQRSDCADACRRAAPVSVRLGGVGTFGDRVIYLQVLGTDLYPLHAALVGAVDLPPGTFELDAYRPHLTLAVSWRPLHLGAQFPAPEAQNPVRRWEAVLALAREEFADLDHTPLTYPVREAVLFCKDAPGQPYHEAERWPLADELTRGG